MIKLPDKHHPDDKKWITEQFQAIPHSMRNSIADKYSAVYGEVYATHEGMPYAHCRARFAANTRLREFVGKVRQTINQAKTIPPRPAAP